MLFFSAHSVGLGALWRESGEGSVLVQRGRRERERKRGRQAAKRNAAPPVFFFLFFFSSCSCLRCWFDLPCQCLFAASLSSFTPCSTLSLSLPRAGLARSVLPRVRREKQTEEERERDGEAMEERGGESTNAPSRILGGLEKGGGGGQEEEEEKTQPRLTLFFSLPLSF